MTKFLDEYFFPPEFHFQRGEGKKEGKERREGKKQSHFKTTRKNTSRS